MTIAEKFNHDFKSGPFELFDSNGNQIYDEDPTGFWVKKEYDSNGNPTYFEYSNGFWVKGEFDSDGNEIYYENSYGEIEDNRPTPSCNGKVV